MNQYTETELKELLDEIYATIENVPLTEAEVDELERIELLRQKGCRIPHEL